MRLSFSSFFQYYDSSYYQGQYYDPATGQYYDYAQYYAQQAGAAVSGADTSTTTSKSESKLSGWCVMLGHLGTRKSKLKII